MGTVVAEEFEADASGGVEEEVEFEEIAFPRQAVGRAPHHGKERERGGGAVGLGGCLHAPPAARLPRAAWRPAVAAAAEETAEAADRLTERQRQREAVAGGAGDTERTLRQLHAEVTAEKGAEPGPPAEKQVEEMLVERAALQRDVSASDA